MEFLKFPKLARLSRDCVVTEKIDGTNAQVYIQPLDNYTNIKKDFRERGWGVIEDKHFSWGITPGSRNKWIKPTKDNYGFAQWTLDHAEELIGLGFGRHFGEWWGQGIQRAYDMKEKKFSLFNTGRWTEKNTPDCCSVVPVLYEGLFDTDVINQTLTLLSVNGSYVSKDFMRPEGIVIFHTASGNSFKKTCENDEKHKGEIKEVSNVLA